MKRIDLVRFYNLLSYYFCHEVYKRRDVITEKSSSCEELMEELKLIQEEDKDE